MIMIIDICNCTMWIVHTWVFSLSCRVESRLDDSDNLGNLGHFLVGQVHLSFKLNYLNVTRISHVL